MKLGTENRKTVILAAVLGGLAILTALYEFMPTSSTIASTETATSSSGEVEPARFNQFRAALGYGGANKRGFSAASSFGFDADVGQLQFVSAQATYNWDCCGMTVEYRRYAIANVRNENLFRFTFTLANIGSFGNLRRQERLY